MAATLDRNQVHSLAKRTTREGEGRDEGSLSSEEPVAPFARTLSDCLKLRAERNPSQSAFLFPANGCREERGITYRELEAGARSIAEVLRNHADPGAFVLLLNSPGLEYIASFFGCLHAGMAPVPGFSPGLLGSGERIEAIARDCGAALAMCDSEKAATVQRSLLNAGLPHIECLAAEPDFARAPAERSGVAASPSDVALLQYTSGSTSTPKGVVLTHANLIANLRAIEEVFECQTGDRLVSWLPPYHDMGLIGCILTPLYAGVEAVLMSPLTFLRRPSRWLEAISRYRATISGGPNFAFDECVRRIRPHHMRGLDLSSWRLAFNGAEPIRVETLERFSEHFASCGFRRKALYPCYGMAESSLIIAGSRPDAAPRLIQVEREALEGDGLAIPSSDPRRSRRIVGCDRIPSGIEVRIVDPKTGIRLAENRVGEIWVRSESAGRGYWQRPRESAATFEAHLPIGGPFLRTGDLGFLSRGALYVTGRIKEVLIIRGRNYYPHDLEAAVSESHPAFRLRPGAAFGLELGAEEKLVIAQELDTARLGTSSIEDLAAVVMQTLSERFGLKPTRILFLPPGALGKTSSGKIQRGRCRDEYLEGRLRTVAEWPRTEEALEGAMDPETDGNNLPVSTANSSRSSPTAAKVGRESEKQSPGEELHAERHAVSAPVTELTRPAEPPRRTGMR